MSRNLRCVILSGIALISSSLALAQSSAHHESAFYQGPKTLDDLADFMAGKMLGAPGLPHDLYPAWNG